MIRHGYADVMVAGGMDATLSPNMFTGWCAMRILSQHNDTPETACRPFSRDRDGMVLGEGAAFVILEELSAARARGAAILAEIVGYGSSYDASHITAPSADGQAAAIRSALEEAELGPGDLDWINAHGTGTLLNDKTETRAVRMVLGDAAARTPMSSIKPMIGHTLGASGAIAFVASCMAMRDGIIPPTINYTEPDPECDLDYVPNEARRAPVRRVMTNAFGFGGNNAVLIAQHPEEP
jgi:3-oxoacyl-[acyl-carrier-protein] synthase II